MVKTGKKKTTASAATERLLKLAGETRNIDEAVRVVVERYFQDIPGPPTDLNAAADRLDVELHEEDLPLSGELRRNGKKLQVVYSGSLGAARRRFTIAHEMAHALFELSGRNPPRTGAELERTCDMLASEILMPTKQFLEAADEDPTPGKILRLSKLFETSLQATSIRYARLKKVSVFQVEGQRVVWGSGVIRSGSLQDMDYGIRTSISEPPPSVSGTKVVLFDHPTWTGEWRLSWEPLGTTKDRALLLMYPLKDSTRLSTGAQIIF
jgi:hypothetical protein